MRVIEAVQGVKVGLTSAGLYDLPANDPQYASAGEEQFEALAAQRPLIEAEARAVAEAKLAEVRAYVFASIEFERSQMCLTECVQNMEPEKLEQNVKALWQAMDLDKDGQVLDLARTYALSTCRGTPGCIYILYLLYILLRSLRSA